METDLPRDQPASDALAEIVWIEWLFAELEMRKVRGIPEARETRFSRREIGEVLQTTKQLGWVRFATEIAVVELSVDSLVSP